MKEDKREINPCSFKQYRRKQIAELRPVTEEEVRLGIKPEGVSISREDYSNGSPKLGDMIARNPKNHKDQWLVAKEYFEDNFEDINTRPEEDRLRKEVEFQERKINTRETKSKVYPKVKIENTSKAWEPTTDEEHQRNKDCIECMIRYNKRENQLQAEIGELKKSYAWLTAEHRMHMEAKKKLQAELSAIKERARINQISIRKKCMPKAKNDSERRMECERCLKDTGYCDVMFITMEIIGK